MSVFNGVLQCVLCLEEFLNVFSVTCAIGVPCGYFTDYVGYFTDYFGYFRDYLVILEIIMVILEFIWLL